jgi:uncharacterized protein (TIGR02270 family)
VRAIALRVAGALGARELLPACSAALADPDMTCRAAARWAALLLGDTKSRETPADPAALASAGSQDDRALLLTLQALPLASGHVVLEQLRREAAGVRRVLWGGGIVGNAAYVPWLVHNMPTPGLARVAGEAFSCITGADLDKLGLSRSRPEAEDEAGEDASDSNVQVDADEGLPWPDPERVQRWWDANEARFQPGVRYFLGAPVTRERCVDVLKTGYQRQRILAAHYLCLLEPGTALFNTSAPAWRQQRLLAEMSGAG